MSRKCSQVITATLIVACVCVGRGGAGWFAAGLFTVYVCMTSVAAFLGLVDCCTATVEEAASVHLVCCQSRPWMNTSCKREKEQRNELPKVGRHSPQFPCLLLQFLLHISNVVLEVIHLGILKFWPEYVYIRTSIKCMIHSVQGRANLWSLQSLCSDTFQSNRNQDVYGIIRELFSSVITKNT